MNIKTAVLETLGWEIHHDIIVHGEIVDRIYAPNGDLYKESGLLLTLNDVNLDYQKSVSLAETLLDNLPAITYLHRCNGVYTVCCGNGYTYQNTSLAIIFCLIFLSHHNIK